MSRKCLHITSAAHIQMHSGQILSSNLDLTAPLEYPDLGPYCCDAGYQITSADDTADNICCKWPEAGLAHQDNLYDK